MKGDPKLKENGMDDLADEIKAVDLETGMGAARRAAEQAGGAA
jgi:hypothetical protein